MKKIFAIASALLLVAVSASAQSKGERYTPKKGDWSIGININPVAAGGFDYQPNSKEFLGAYINALAENPSEMYIPGQSLTSIKVKKYLTNSLAVKATLGFTGSHLSYKEYVDDDYAHSINGLSDDKVTDSVLGNLAGGTLALGLQKSLGTGNLKFTLGADVAYTVGAGTLNFKYGNDFAPYNGYKPTSMASTTMDPGAALNDYNEVKFGISYARPYKRNDIGTVMQAAFYVNAGLEYFLADHISLGLEAVFSPIAFTWQSQSWAIYEGYSTYVNKLMTYNKLISPGSHAITYGTGNFGVNISVNYYF